MAFTDSMCYLTALLRRGPLICHTPTSVTYEVDPDEWEVHGRHVLSWLTLASNDDDAAAAAAAAAAPVFGPELMHLGLDAGDVSIMSFDPAHCSTPVPPSSPKEAAPSPPHKFAFSSSSSRKRDGGNVKYTVAYESGKLHICGEEALVQAMTTLSIH